MKTGKVEEYMTKFGQDLIQALTEALTNEEFKRKVEEALYSAEPTSSHEEVMQRLRNKVKKWLRKFVLLKFYFWNSM